MKETPLHSKNYRLDNQYEQLDGQISYLNKQGNLRGI